MKVGERHTAQKRLSTGRILELALWSGLWTGLGIVLAYGAGTLFASRTVYFDTQLVWTAPLSNILLFCAIGALLIAVGTVMSSARSAVAVLAVFLSTIAFSATLLYPRISRVALLALSVGIGVQLARLIAPRLGSLLPFLRRTLVGGAILVLAMAVTVNARQALRERAATDRLGTPPAGAPNVLLIILDTVRALNIGAWGYERPTSPFLDEFAKRGVLFDYAFAAAPWTLSSHGTMFTGHWPFDLTASWRIPLGDDPPTIAAALTAEGYATAGFVANYIYGPPVYGLGHGFTHYSGWPLTVGSILDTAPILSQLAALYNEAFNGTYEPNRRNSDRIARLFRHWHDGLDRDRPWFAFLNLFDAHEPYRPPAPWDTLFGQSEHRRIPPQRPTANVVRDMTDAYDGGIAYMDHVLRSLIDGLDASGDLDNTVVIITSDHGEHLGERDLLDHGNSLYAPLLHVPLIIAWGNRVPAGERVADAVSLRDLAATIADLTESRTSFPGRSLARFWTPGSAPTQPDTLYAAVEYAPRQRPWYPLAKGSMRSLIVWPHHYIVNGDGTEELYDLSIDPLETGPSIADPDLLPSMREALARYPARMRAGQHGGSAGAGPGEPGDD